MSREKPARQASREEGLTERLLRDAGPRPLVPPEIAERVRAAVHPRWQEAVEARRRRIRLRSMNAALALAALVVFVLWQAGSGRRRQAVPAQPVARVEALTGSGVVLASPGGSAGSHGRPQVGAALPAGADLETAIDGRAALRLAQGASLRLDAGTRLRLLSASAIHLEHGAVYVDSGDHGRQAGVRLSTPLSVVRDLGTRFEVRFGSSVLEVRVRSGVVALSGPTASARAAAGEELRLDRDGLSRRPIPLSGPGWDWTARIAPPFAVEGRTLRSFLDWAARETGRTLRFADPATQELATRTTLHGSLQGLGPDDALAPLLTTCRLRHRIEADVLLVMPDGTGSPP